MSVFLTNATRILHATKLQAENVDKAKNLLKEIKETSLNKKAILDSATLRNVIILLTPFIAYYKVNQVIKLLKELEKDMKQPSSEFKQYI